MKLIPLTKGKFAIVDDADYEALLRFKWHASPSYGTWYARRGDYRKGKSAQTIRMHRWIMCATGMGIDHVNGNGLDNRRSNLRFATGTQNAANRKIPTNNTSGIKGVYFDKDNKRWRARIGIQGKKYSLGLFANIEDAAEAYRSAAKYHFGDFAKC